MSGPPGSRPVSETATRVSYVTPRPVATRGISATAPRSCPSVTPRSPGGRSRSRPPSATWTRSQLITLTVTMRPGTPSTSVQFSTLTQPAHAGTLTLGPRMPVDATHYSAQVTYQPNGSFPGSRGDSFDFQVTASKVSSVPHSDCATVTIHENPPLPPPTGPAAANDDHRTTSAGGPAVGELAA